MAKKYAKPETKWSVVEIQDTDTELEMRADMLREKGDMASIFSFIKGTLLSGRYNSHYKHTHNSLVGLEELSEAEFDAKVANLCSWIRKEQCYCIFLLFAYAVYATEPTMLPINKPSRFGKSFDILRVEGAVCKGISSLHCAGFTTIPHTTCLYSIPVVFDR
jgi:hypothetical protein